MNTIDFNDPETVNLEEIFASVAKELYRRGEDEGSLIRYLQLALDEVKE
jgi:hypothetical protein